MATSVSRTQLVPAKTIGRTGSGYVEGVPERFASVAATLQSHQRTVTSAARRRGGRARRATLLSENSWLSSRC